MWIINVASHTKCCCTSHIHSIALNSCPAERSAFPQQKYPHCLAGQRLKISRQCGSSCPNQLPAFPRVGRASWLCCPLQMKTVQRGKEIISVLHQSYSSWVITVFSLRCTLYYKQLQIEKLKISPKIQQRILRGDFMLEKGEGTVQDSGW